MAKGREARSPKEVDDILKRVIKKEKLYNYPQFETKPSNKQVKK